MKGKARQETNKISDKVVKDIIKSQPRDYFKVKYELEVLGPEMMRKQAILDERKRLYKPIRSEEIENHNKLHEERLRILSNVKQAYKMQDQRRNYHTPVKSVFYERVLKRDHKKQVNQIKQAKKKQELILRRKKYGEYVKQFINNPEMSEDEYEYEDDDYREPTNDVGRSRSRKELPSHSQLAQHKSEDNRIDKEEVYGRTVRHRKMLYDNLGYGSLIPQGRPQGERSFEDSAERKSKYTSLNNVQQDPIHGYKRDIRSEYKAHYVNHTENDKPSEPLARPKGASPYHRKIKNK